MIMAIGDQGKPYHPTPKLAPSQRASEGAPPTLVPGLSVLPAAADVGHGEHPAEVAHEDEAGDAVAGRDGDVEAAVAVEEGGVGAVQLQPLLMHHKHGHLGAVLTGVEDLQGGTGERSISVRLNRQGDRLVWPVTGQEGLVVASSRMLLVDSEWNHQVGHDVS